MSYFGILAVFIIPPVLILMVLLVVDSWRGISLRTTSFDPIIYASLVTMPLIALLYTTPWDNYLVAQGVWWYDHNLVTGIIFGWVPLEEYVFFVLQALLTGLWMVFLIRYIFHPNHSYSASRSPRVLSSIMILLIWLIAVMMLLLDLSPGRYLALILLWGLPPILLQFVSGADILYANGRLLLIAILPPTLYLWLVDAVAIRSGTWTIDPGQTTGIYFGILPIEEMLFFLVTNLLVCFGIILMTSPIIQVRLRNWSGKVLGFAR